MKFFLILTLICAHSCSARKDGTSQVTNLDPRIEKTLPQEKPYKFTSNAAILPNGKMNGILKNGKRYCSVAEAFAQRIRVKYTSTPMPDQLQKEIQWINNMCFAGEYQLFGEKQYLADFNEKFLVNFNSLGRSFQALKGLSNNYEGSTKDYFEILRQADDFEEISKMAYAQDYFNIYGSLDSNLKESYSNWQDGIYLYYRAHARFE